MDKKFVCVFDEKSRDLLLAKGFIPMKFDEHNSIFVFCNSKTIEFTFSKVAHLFTDILTF